jgi:hypothetical protein
LIWTAFVWAAATADGVGWLVMLIFVLGIIDTNAINAYCGMTFPERDATPRVEEVTVRDVARGRSSRRLRRPRLVVRLTVLAILRPAPTAAGSAAGSAQGRRRAGVGADRVRAGQAAWPR